MKSIVDFIASFIGLLLLIPFFIIISLLILFDDGWPVLFKQKRVGKNGKLFILYKFRSMKVIEVASDGSFEPGNDSRVTKIGKFLRKTKLDELPQLFNVIIGEMSLVGPRPEVEKWVAVYPMQWKKILTLKPGITDNASIFYRREESLLAESEDPEKTYKEIILPKKLKYYEDYVDTRSFFGDLKLIIKTLISFLQ